MIRINQTDKPKQRTGFQLEVLDGELLLYHVGSARIFCFNQTAALIWQLCNGEHTIAEIIEVLIEAYPQSKDDIAAQVEAALAEFLEQAVIDMV